MANLDHLKKLMMENGLIRPKSDRAAALMLIDIDGTQPPVVEGGGCNPGCVDGCPLSCKPGCGTGCSGGCIPGNMNGPG